MARKTTVGLQLWAVESIPERESVLAEIHNVVGDALGTPYCYYTEGTHTLFDWALVPEQ